MIKSPPIVHPEGSVTPDVLVLEIVTSFSVGDEPAMVRRPLPLKSTSPVLEKAVPRRVIVAGLAGAKLKVPPALVTVPLLVKNPPKV